MTDAEKIEKVKELVTDGAWTDGGMHKQWYLCQIADVVGADLSDEGGCILDTEDRGIAP